jgi:hypothetical protein
LAAGLAAAGRDRHAIEQQLGEWKFHPAVAFTAARGAVDARDRARRPDGSASDFEERRSGVAQREAE